MNRLKALALVAALLAVMPARADEGTATPTAGVTGFVLGGAYEFGGDPVVTVNTGTETKELKAGDGIAAAVGIHHRFAASPMSLRGTIGFKLNGMEANGVNYALTRVPLELIASYHFANQARIGAGFVVHAAGKVTSDFAPDVDLKDAGGFEVEAGYRMLLFTLTGMDYEAKSGGPKVKAGSVGFRLVFEFGSPTLQ